MRKFVRKVSWTGDCARAARWGSGTAPLGGDDVHAAHTQVIRGMRLKVRDLPVPDPQNLPADMRRPGRVAGQNPHLDRVLDLFDLLLAQVEAPVEAVVALVGLALALGGAPELAEHAD